MKRKLFIFGKKKQLKKKKSLPAFTYVYDAN